MLIQIDPFDVKSVDNAIQKIQEYKNSLSEKIDRLVTELLKLGMEIIEYQYSTAEPGFATLDYEVSCITNGDSSMIIAEGSDVVFLEFGAGVYTANYLGEVESSGLPVIAPGSYSQTEGSGQFRPGHEYWWFGRRKYEGLVPCLGFYHASKEIREQAVTIAKRIFTK